MNEAIGRIKGAAFREFVRFCEQRLGRSAVRESALALPTAHRQRFDVDRDALGIIASTWYPAESVHALLDAMVMPRAESERATLVRDASQHTLDVTLRGLYRMLFEAIATPERYGRHAGKLWAAYYDSGRLEVTETRRNGADSRIVEWRAHHPFLCDLNAAAPAVIYRAMGCTDARSKRVACVDRGDPHCAFVTTW